MKTVRRTFLMLGLWLGFLAGSHCAPARDTATTGPADVRITVTNESLHPVGDLLFGQFMEKPSWGGETGPEAAVAPGTSRLDARVEALLRKMEIPVVRFPGGTDVDYLDWRDMVNDGHGANAGRPNSAGRNKQKTITNAFGYDEYFQLAGELRWKSILVVNLRDGLLSGRSTAEAADHAAALLAYCAGSEAELPEAFRKWPRLRAANGRPEPYAVEYVQIGNESWFWTGEMKKKHGEGWVKTWADGVETYIAALKKIKPDVRIIADGHPLEIAAELSRRKASVDLYALHRYYPMGIEELFTPGGESVAPETATAKQLWELLVHSTETDAAGLAQWQDKSIDQAKRLGYRLALTEWNLNGWWQIKDQKDLWPGPGACGLGAAVMLNATLRRGDVIALATQSMLLGRSWGITGIRVAPGSEVAPYYMPTAVATTFYRRSYGDRLLRTRYDIQPPLWKPEVCFSKTYRVCEKAAVVDVAATRDDRRLYLHIVNTSYDQPYRLDARLDGFGGLPDRGELHRLRFLTKVEADGGSLAVEDTERIELAGPALRVTVPPRSAVIAAVDIGAR